MRCLRLLLSVAVIAYMTGGAPAVFAQDTDSSAMTFTLAPVEFAGVKGNVGKFEALNWMPANTDQSAGISNLAFVKDINKDVSLDVSGSAYPGVDDGKGHLVLKDGDLAFLKVDYNAFRKYFDNTGGVYHYPVNGTPYPEQFEGVKANSPDLQLDLSFLKLEAGLGEIDDPYIDFIYEHDTKDGDKSLEQWAPVYVTSTGSGNYRKIGPSWESIDDTTDTFTLKEKKEIAGITVKGEQTAEIEYNHNDTFMQYLDNGLVGSQYTQLSSENEYLDARLFGSGVRLEKWMNQDKTFTGFGYHFNRVKDADEMQNLAQTETNGIVNPPSLFTSQANQSLWNYSSATENEHVFTANINQIVTPDLTFVTDARYEHMGAEGSSTYYAEPSSGTYPANPSAVYDMEMANHQDTEGEHIALHYSGIPHTSLYAESELQQQRNWTWQYYDNLLSPAMTTSSSNFFIQRLDRSQNENWTLGGRIVPNRYITFTSQVKQRWEDDEYDTVSLLGTPTDQTFLDALKVNGVEETSTLTWRPYRWLENSLKYQFMSTDYMPQQAAEGKGVGDYPISKNHMLSSGYTYEINVQPVDPLMLMFSYSHVESYVRTSQDSQSGVEYLPDFNSGDNSFIFSTSYTPNEKLVWTNTMCYTVANNFVDFNTGIPLGSDFKMFNFTTGLDWTYHKWLKIGPQYEYAAYKDDPLSGTGNYSANIFTLNIKFNW